MKKDQIIAGLSIAAISAAAFGQLAFAQSTTGATNLAQLVPADVDQFIEFNTGVTNPFSEMMTAMFDNFSLSGGDGLTPEEIQSVKDIFNSELKNNTLSLATKNVMQKSAYGDYSYPVPEAYGSVHMTTEDFNKIIALLGSKMTKETVNGMTVYNSSPDTYFTMVGDLAVFTSTRERMTGLLDMYTKQSGTPLSRNENYLASRAKDLPGSFMNMYINPDQYMNTMDGVADMTGVFGGLMSAQKELLGALKAEGVSISQTATGFNFGVFVKGDGAKLTQLNLNFDRYNFIPELYRYVNGSNVMLFGEESNLRAKIQDMMKLFTTDAATNDEFTQWKATFKTDSGMDFDTDFLSLFNGKYAMSVHKTSQIYPTVTFMFDVRNNKDKAVEVLQKTMNYVEKSFNGMEKEEGTDFFNRTTKTFNDTAYYELTFDPTKMTDPDPDLLNLPAEKVVLNIHATITSQGFLIITNAANVSDVFTTDGNGMLNNANFNAAFTNRDESTAGVGYMNADVLQEYVNMFMTDFSAPAEARDFFNGLLDPWHDIYTKAYGTTDSTWATGFVNVDTAGFAKYPELFQTYMGTSYDYDYTDYIRPSKNFCDVRDSDWFAPYVNDLSKDYIVNGYEDGCFRPGRDITRAEFTKMVIAVKNSADPVYTDDNKQYFTDVASNNNGTEWYTYDVNYAGAAHYVNGYPDGSFRPNAPITRAEAVKILFNMNLQLSAQEWSENFSDVNDNDWFSAAVKWAFNQNIVSGTSPMTFDPNRNINRAEAAKIIKLFRDLQLSQTAGTGM